MTRILLTGASGYIGRCIATGLTAREHEFQAISSSPRHDEGDGVTWHHCDLMDAEATKACVAAIKPDVLIHSAWFVGHGQFWTSDLNYAWVQASLTLIEAFKSAGGRRVVLVGSCAEYDWDYGFCSEEITPLNPSTPYGVCKAALFHMANAYADTHGLSLAWARIFFTFGGHEAPERLVPSVARALLANEPARCTEGTQIRDFMPVLDCGDAIAALALSPVTGAVNIASGKPHTLRDIVEMLADKLNARRLLQIGAMPMREDDLPLILADVRRLNKEVGWQPSLSLSDGLDMAIDWWREQS